MTPTQQRGIYYPGVRIPKAVAVDPAGENMTYSYANEPNGQEWRRPTDRGLLAFAKLGNAAPEAIRDYARRYGVLQAVQVRPKAAAEGDFVMRDKTVWRFGHWAALEVLDPHDEFSDVRWRLEPLRVWRALAEQVRALLRINAALKGRSHNPSPALSPEDWEIIDPGGASLDDPLDEKFFLNMLVNRWLLMGGVRLELYGGVKLAKWELEVAYNGLVGALAYRLLLMVVGEDRLYVCSGCGGPYIRDSRAPRPGQENFCRDCVEVPARRAVERYRQKNRSRKEKS
jgi:hypothetical protein